MGRNAASYCLVTFARALPSLSERLRLSALSPSDANIQLSNMNISPSSLLIFLTPIGFSLLSFSWMSRLRLTCTSSSGKYFICLGRLCGHCDSAVVEKAQRKRIAGGSANRPGIFIVVDVRCKWYLGLDARYAGERKRGRSNGFAMAV